MLGLATDFLWFLENLHASSTTTDEGHPAEFCQVPPSLVRMLSTYIDAYTPGRRAFTTESGNGLNQRSGFHLSASGPQICLLLFALRIEIKTFVSFFSGIDVISVLPSDDFTGHISGRTTSSLVLRSQ